MKFSLKGVWKRIRTLTVQLEKGMQSKQPAAKEEKWIFHSDTNTRSSWAALCSSVYSLMWTHVQRDNSNFCLVKFSPSSWLFLHHWFNHLTFCCRLIPLLWHLFFFWRQGMDSIQKYMLNKHKIIILGGFLMSKCFYISRRKREVGGRQMKGGDWEERMWWGNCILDKVSRG